jgi:hypothetical protein
LLNSDSDNIKGSAKKDAFIATMGNDKKSMKKQIITPIDSPWKTLIEQYFEELITFFFPDIDTLIDWTRGYEFLDQEFQQIVRDAELGRRLADKLVKVWKKNGQEIILYIHIEIQGQWEENFSKRMFVYHYRILDRYDGQIISVAILTDDNPNWKPRSFGYKQGGCHLSFRFPIAKLTDYRKKLSELKKSSNPFATVVQIHLKGLETRTSPKKRFYWKKELTKALYEAKFSKKDGLELFHFMDWMFKLPKELANQFDDFIEQYEAEKKVQYITHIERRGIEKGFAQGRIDGLKNGLAEGIETGITKGITKGIAEGRAEMLFRLLDTKFGPLDKEIQETIYRLDEQRLFEMFQHSLTAKTLRDIDFTESKKE